MVKKISLAAQIANQVEMFERMDGLVATGNHEGFEENAKGMIADLKTEGFERADIMAYLRSIIREAFK